MGGWPTEPSDHGVTFSPHPLKTSFFQVVLPGVLCKRISLWSDFFPPSPTTLLISLPPLFLFSFSRSLVLWFLLFPIRLNWIVWYLFWAKSYPLTPLLVPYAPSFLTPPPGVLLSALKGEKYLHR